MRDHIHTPDDGRGQRIVTVNGKALDGCFYADTRKGVTKFYGAQPRLHKHGKRLIENTARGLVVVVPIC
jgi:hypothetical protein